MSSEARSLLRSAVVSAVVALLIAGTPAVGAALVRFAHNADMVDGRHAVGAKAARAARAGKIVATGKTGLLPNNIIAVAPNAARLGGKRAAKYALRSALSAPGTINQSINPVHWSRLRGVPAAFADGRDAIGPFAYAHISDAGDVDGAALNVASDDVERPGNQTGIYCFTLSFVPKQIQVTTDQRLSSGTTDAGIEAYASFNSAALTANCAAGADAVVIFRDAGNVKHNAAFFVSFM
jgi:hypothetical protein